MRILGAIIAGGQSTRMGGDEKAFLGVGGVPLIERVISRIRFQLEDVIINANGDPERFSSTGCVVVADQLPEIKTPLAGVHAALAYGRKHGFDAVLTVPSDCPLLPLDLVQRLEAAGRGTGAAVAYSGIQTHYLTGLWSTALAPVLEDQIIRNGMVRVQDFVTLLATEKVEWPVMPHDPFFNINTPEDLAQAEQQLNA
jgi:molybdenum cofactor guanylyltransferase